MTPYECEECHKCGEQFSLDDLVNCCTACYPKANEWINVKDKQPEKDGRYLVVEKGSHVWIGVCSLRNGKWDLEITHWQTLPEPPQ